MQHFAVFFHIYRAEATKQTIRKVSYGNEVVTEW